MKTTRREMLIGASAVAASCGGGRRPRIPEGTNVLVLCADEHHAGFMGSAGHPDARTPNLDRLALEIDQGYGTSMRKAVVDYVLERPAECLRLGVPKVAPTVPRMAINTHEWRESVFAAMEYMEAHLHTTNPVMVEVLSSWQSFSDLRLVDTQALTTTSGDTECVLPCQLSTFYSSQSQVCRLFAPARAF